MPKMKNLLAEDRKIIKHIMSARTIKDPNKRFERDYNDWTFETRCKLEDIGKIKPKKHSPKSMFYHYSR